MGRCDRSADWASDPNEGPSRWNQEAALRMSTLGNVSDRHIEEVGFDGFGPEAERNLPPSETPGAHHDALEATGGWELAGAIHVLVVRVPTLFSHAEAMA